MIQGINAEGMRVCACIGSGWERERSRICSVRFPSEKEVLKSTRIYVANKCRLPLTPFVIRLMVYAYGHNFRGAYCIKTHVQILKVCNYETIDKIEHVTYQSKHLLEREKYVRYSMNI